MNRLEGGSNENSSSRKRLAGAKADEDGESAGYCADYQGCPALRSAAAPG